MNDYVYLNGELTAREQAQVSVFDRGYLFADGIYEVVRIANGRPFRLQQHQKRLGNSLQGLGIVSDIVQLLPGIAAELIAANRLSSSDSALLYLQVTRGVQIPRLHDPQPGLKPQIFAYLQAVPAKAKPQGISLQSMPDPRWQHCNIKSIGLVANVLARRQAQQAGHNDVLFIRAGVVTESSTSSFFCSDGELVYTARLSSDILPSVTRSVVIEACQSAGIKVLEQDFDLAHVRACEQMWLASTGSGIVPVAQLDQQRLQLPATIIDTVSQYHQRMLEQN